MIQPMQHQFPSTYHHQSTTHAVLNSITALLRTNTPTPSIPTERTVQLAATKLHYLVFYPYHYHDNITKSAQL